MEIIDTKENNQIITDAPRALPEFDEKNNPTKAYLARCAQGVIRGTQERKINLEGEY